MQAGACLERPELVRKKEVEDSATQTSRVYYAVIKPETFDMLIAHGVKSEVLERLYIAISALESPNLVQLIVSIRDTLRNNLLSRPKIKDPMKIKTIIEADTNSISPCDLLTEDLKKHFVLRQKINLDKAVDEETADTAFKIADEIISEKKEQEKAEQSTHELKLGKFNLTKYTISVSTKS